VILAKTVHVDLCCQYRSRILENSIYQTPLCLD